MHHEIFFAYSRVKKDFNSVPKQVKILFFGMFVYILGWGIFDPFISIFFHNILGNYSAAGFLYGLFFLIGAGFSIPAGGLADKINKIKYSVRSMLLYPFLGLIYFTSPFIAGVAGIALLFVGRVFHGFLALFWIMAEGFIREHSPKGEASAIFGLYITTYKLAYVIAPLFTIPLIILLGLTTKTVHWLALALVFFPPIAAFIISRVQDKGMPVSQGLKAVVVEDGIFLKEVKDMKGLGFPGIVVMMLGFFINSINAIIFFLLPLYAVSLNMSLIEIAILFSLINIPYLLSFFFAELADSFGKVNMISLGLITASIGLFTIASVPSISANFYIAALGLGVILAMLRPASNGLITDITPLAKDGEMTGIYKMVFTTGGFVSAIAFGILSDAFGLSFPFLVLAVLLFVMALLTYSIKRKIIVNT